MSFKFVIFLPSLEKRRKGFTFPDRFKPTPGSEWNELNRLLGNYQTRFLLSADLHLVAVSVLGLTIILRENTFSSSDFLLFRSTFQLLTPPTPTCCCPSIWLLYVWYKNHYLNFILVFIWQDCPTIILLFLLMSTFQWVLIRAHRPWSRTPFLILTWSKCFSLTLPLFILALKWACDHASYYWCIIYVFQLRLNLFLGRHDSSVWSLQNFNSLACQVI